MKALENRTLDSKREMDIMSALDELQTLNKRQARVDTDAALAALQRSAADDGEGEVRRAALMIFLIIYTRGPSRRTTARPRCKRGITLCGERCLHAPHYYMRAGLAPAGQSYAEHGGARSEMARVTVPLSV